jgi:hypothetical protein
MCLNYNVLIINHFNLKNKEKEEEEERRRGKESQGKEEELNFIAPFIYHTFFKFSLSLSHTQSSISLIILYNTDVICRVLGPSKKASTLATRP